MSKDAGASRGPTPETLRQTGAVALGLTAGLSFFSAPIVTVAAVSLRPMDLPLLVAITAWALLRIQRVRSGARAAGASRGAFAGYDRLMAASALVFGFIVVASAVWVTITEGGGISAVVSSARVVETIVVGVLAGVAVRNRTSLATTVRAMLGGVTGLLVVNAVGVMLAPGVAAALGVTLGPNGKAFIGPAAVAAIIASLLFREWPVWNRILLALLAVVGLLSVSSITAYLVLTVVVAALSGLQIAPEGSLRRVVGAATVGFVVTGALSYIALTEVRPGALPSLDVAAQLVPEAGPSSDGHVSGTGAARGGLSGQAEDRRVTEPDGAVAGATVLHRAILAYTAIQVFATEPVTGVGWTRGADREIVGDPSIAAAAREAFPGAWATLFTDEAPTGAHNAVLQALAELGIVGTVPLVVLLLASVGLAARGLYRHEVQRATDLHLFVLGSVLIAVGFLMTNGLFPGQPETVVWAWAAGCAAGRAGADSARSEVATGAA